MTKKIIIDDVDVNECEFYCYSGNHGELTHYCTYQKDEDGLDTHCNADFNKNCFYKKILRRLKRKEQECERLKKFLNEIRYEELSSLDIDLDEYETSARQLDYSNIITLVERALGEIDV